MMLGACAAIFAITLANLALHPKTGPLDCAVYGLIGGMAFSLRDLRLGRAMSRDLAFMDRTVDAEEFACEIVVGTGGRPLGTDRGVLWITDGRIGFAGRCCSFLLTRSDFLHSSPEARTEKRLPRTALQLNAQEGSAFLDILPLQADRSRYSIRMKEFWSVAAPESERQWPPLEPYDASALPQGAVSEGMRR